MNPKENMIIANDKIITPDVVCCNYNSYTHKYDVQFKNGKTYHYNYTSVKWLREPQMLDPNKYHLSRENCNFFDVVQIYLFESEYSYYFHVCFRNGTERDYFGSEITVKVSCLNDDTSKNVFDYLKHTATLTSIHSDDGTNLLLKQYEKIDFIDEQKALALYLNPSKFKSEKYRTSIPIFPFGCNSSQYSAVINALENQISVIEGPPGTGKTQTILNIVANLIVQGKTVQIVSNNNWNGILKVQSTNTQKSDKIKTNLERKKDHEVQQAEQQIKDELEGKDRAEQDLLEQAEIVKTFQVVSGDMFSKANEPILSIKPGVIHFNQACRKKLDTEYIEILFNPVERMIVARACDNTNPNAFLWDGKPKSARSLCRILYDSLGWNREYNYSVPCQEMPIMLSDNTVRKVLVFDLDNLIGKAIKKDEIIIPKKQSEETPDRADDSKSFYFPPDAGDEPQELVEIAEQVQRELEINKRIFGTPAFKHSSVFRNIDGEYAGEEWFIPARPTDIDHKISDDVIDSLMTAIEQNPPKPPTERYGNEQTVIDVSSNDTGVN